MMIHITSMKNGHVFITRKQKMKNKNEKAKEETTENQPKKKILKGIICLLFGHDWVSYNEHCYMCSRCMAVAPKG